MWKRDQSQSSYMCVNYDLKGILHVDGHCHIPGLCVEFCTLNQRFEQLLSQDFLWLRPVQCHVVDLLLGTNTLSESTVVLYM